ncbi:MAG: cupin domain-containing protein [Deltaproteobacteria bacterium]|nr:cupin domain-containing protein [Deltaproteobacteria bacterium]
MSKGYIIKKISEVAPIPCPCGEATRALTGQDNDVMSVHVVNISKDSKVHYHKKLTETYYVLEGNGTIHLDDDVEPLEPGTIVMIKPGTKHRAVGNLKILNIVIPPFDPSDEYLIS